MISLQLLSCKTADCAQNCAQTGRNSDRRRHSREGTIIATRTPRTEQIRAVPVGPIQILPPGLLWPDDARCFRTANLLNTNHKLGKVRHTPIDREFNDLPLVVLLDRLESLEISEVNN